MLSGSFRHLPCWYRTYDVRCAVSLLSVELPHGTCCTSLQAPKHTVIIGSCFRVAVPVEEKEVAVTVNSNSFCTPAPFQHSVKCFILFRSLEFDEYRFSFLVFQCNILFPHFLKSWWSTLIILFSKLMSVSACLRKVQRYEALSQAK